MYIDIVPNRNSPPAVLLRESYREGKKVLKRTIANLSEVPRNIVEGLRILLRGGAAVEHFAEIERREGLDFGLQRATHLSVALAPAHLERLRACPSPGFT